MLYPEFKYVGFKSDLQTPTAIGRTDEIQIPTQPMEFFQSIYRFDESILPLPSLASVPRGTLAYADYLVLDLDAPGSLPRAYADALAICGKLDAINAWYELHFSGNKGFHVLIPTSQFGFEPTSDEGILKRMAEGIKGDIKTLKEGGTFDPSIYNFTRVFRFPGTWNKGGGKYKNIVPAPYVRNGVANISLEAILEASCDQPEYDQPDYSGLPLNEALVALYEFCKKPAVKAPAATTASVGDDLFAPCLEGGRNEKAFTIAHKLFKKGLFRSDVEWILGQWNSTNPRPLAASELGKVIWSAEKGRVELATTDLDSVLHSIDGMLDELKDDSQRNKKKFRTGYDFIDQFTLGGFEEEEMVFVGGRSANFKTSTLTNILQRGTALARKPGLFFSQEMGKKTLRPRLIQQAEGLTKAEVLERMAKGDNFEKTREAFQYLQIVYLSSLTTEQMMDIIEAFYKRHGTPSVIGVDYLGLFRGCQNDTAKTAKQAQDLKTIVAKDAKCPVFCLNQVKQSYEGREGDRELGRNSGKDSDSILDLSDYYIGIWGHWHTFVNEEKQEATEEKMIYGRFLKARGMDSDKYPPHPYMIFDWDKPRLQLKDILYVPNPPKFKQPREEQ